jgi:hypothetical protein
MRKVTDNNMIRTATAAFGIAAAAALGGMACASPAHADFCNDVLHLTPGGMAFQICEAKGMGDTKLPSQDQESTFAAEHQDWQNCMEQYSGMSGGSAQYCGAEPQQ